MSGAFIAPPQQGNMTSVRVVLVFRESYHPLTNFMAGVVIVDTFEKTLASEPGHDRSDVR